MGEVASFGFISSSSSYRFRNLKAIEQLVSLLSNQPEEVMSTWWYNAVIVA